MIRERKNTMTNNVLQFLERSAERLPDKAAVVEGAENLSYAQLLQRSKAVGTALSELIPPRKPTGVYMEKGIDALVAFLGIVYAGGCYSMFTPELPDHRLTRMQSVLSAEVIVTTQIQLPKARALFPEARILTIESLYEAPIDEARLQAIRRKMIDTDPLYINFTSGSTGTPKGIAVAHRSVIDFISCFTELFHITERDRIANQAPFDFDVSVKDIYSALSVGATLVIVPRILFSVPVRLLDYLCLTEVTTMIWAVSALCLITTFHGLDYRTPRSVDKVLFSGEVMPQKALRDWRNHLPEATFVNLYGPTEITCNCTYHILQKERDYSEGIPIGTPFPNEDVFLLNDNDEPINAPGETGRIMVRGTALALGYYGSPEKTAASFIQNPLSGVYPETVYETGDLGAYNERGELLYRGRRDNQIKYMGHRVELEEIERAMDAVEGVERSVCVFDRTKSRLKGYYVGEIETEALSAALHRELPLFMVPGYLRKLDEIPLTKNGKADRQKIAGLAEGSEHEIS